jgi:hypothetical protein
MSYIACHAYSQDAVTELHAIFKWAKKSSNGLLLFIDEAEAFLSSRACKYTMCVYVYSLIE